MASQASAGKGRGSSSPRAPCSAPVVCWLYAQPGSSMAAAVLGFPPTGNTEKHKEMSSSDVSFLSRRNYFQENSSPSYLFG